MRFRHAHGEFDLSRRTYLVGIVNVTPDSFSDGGRFLRPEAAVAHALELVNEGADILDIGGESTRPGAQPVSEQEELQRVIPVIRRLRERTAIPISVDTYKGRVAAEALAAGASIVNDISSFRFDPAMASVVAGSGAGVFLMHMQGTPRTMQQAPRYHDVVTEVRDFLRERIEFAQSCGIELDRIAVDPGIGFGKTLDHNLQLLRSLREFQSLGCGLLVGTSRKSFIGTITGRPVAERDAATAATVALSIAQGAHFVRVHNVRFCRDAALVSDAVVRGNAG